MRTDIKYTNVEVLLNSIDSFTTTELEKIYAAVDVELRERSYNHDIHNPESSL